jgi:hypothetical protein
MTEEAECVAAVPLGVEKEMVEDPGRAVRVLGRGVVVVDKVSVQ